MNATRRVLLCGALMMGLAPLAHGAFAAEPAPVPLPTLQNFGPNRSWFYSAAIPFAFQNSTFLALSVSPDGVHNPPKEPSKDDLADPIWLDFWKDGESNLAQLRLGGYDYARDIPFPLSTEEDLYLFFFRSAKNITGESPVVRRTPGGWAWQRLDTVEKSIKAQVRIANFGAGKVLDGNGQTLADLKAVNRALTKYVVPAELIDLGCRIEAGDKGKQVLGLAARLAGPSNEGNTKTPQVKTSKRSPLPYRDIFLYEARMDDPNGVGKVVKLDIATSDMKTPGSEEEAPLEVRASRLTDEDALFFGKPVVEPKSGRVFYWYCIQSQRFPNRQTFILAFYDGQSTRALSGYTLRLPHSLRVWDGKEWREENKSLDWLYGAATKIAPQPVVGLDASGAVIAYRSGDWLRLP